mgnify:CR=1 FL=1
MTLRPLLACLLLSLSLTTQAATEAIALSYRSADGTKDASRLADDLGDAFGAGQVFLDRHDLRGGGSWREAIDNAIGKRPVVLLLITPAFFGARHDDGRLRIEDTDDPVRGEILSAIAAGATLMPLRVDGTPMPAADSLPEPLRTTMCTLSGYRLAIMRSPVMAGLPSNAPLPV